MPRAAAIFDLDRTVLRASSTPVILRHLQQAGLVRRRIPAEALFQRSYELFGDAAFGQSTVRSQSGVKRGWKVKEIAEISEGIADELEDMVLPFVPALFESHRQEGRLIVLATASNGPVLQAFAERLGVDHLVATKWAVDGEEYTGELDGVRLVGKAKRDAVVEWAEAEGVDLAASYAYSDSRYDVGMLAAVGHPVAVNPDAQLALIAALRRWPIRWLDKPEGVVKVLGRELQDWLRPLSHPNLDATANIEIEGAERIPKEGGAILVFNHRSYFDSTAVSYLIAASGRTARFLGKKEVFDVPVAGTVGKAMGGIRVDRGTGSNEPLERAIEALKGGDMIAMAPQGTIPRGPAFFDPELKGRWGAARLAIATGAQVIPVGLWGTEKVWPRSSRIPRIPRPGQHKPTVTVTVGEPFRVSSDDVDTATKEIMSHIADLLPAEARKRRKPTEDELRRTYPPGYKGDPSAESDRRPGSDT